MIYCMPECWKCGKRYRWYYREFECPRRCPKCRDVEPTKRKEALGN